MKSLYKIISVVLCLSSLFLAGSFTASNIMKKDLVTFVWSTSEIDNKLMDLLDYADVNIPLKERNELTKIKNKIRLDERMKKIDEKLLPYFIRDIIGNSQSDIKFVVDDFVNIVKDYDDQLAPYIQNKKASEVLSVRVTFDIQQAYGQQVRLTKANAPVPLMLLIMMVYYLSFTAVKVISVIVLVASIVYLLMKLKDTNQWGKPIGYALCTSGSITLVLMATFQLIYKTLPYSYTSTIGNFNSSNYYIMAAFGLSYLIIGIAVISANKKIKISQKQEEV